MKEFKTDRFFTALQNPEKAFSALEASVKAPIKIPRDRSGIIKDFELAYELAWKSLKKFLENAGHETKSARDTFSKAFELGYINNEGVWLEILQDRSQTVHTYDQKFAQEMCDRIKTSYLIEFKKLLTTLTQEGGKK